MDKLKAKVGGESVFVPFHRLIEDFCRYSVECREVFVEKHAVAAKDHDSGVDLVERDGFALWHRGMGLSEL